MLQTSDPVLLQQEHDKIVYKNQKRKVRNKLIYLVGIHILFIFVFVALLCFEYLTPDFNFGNAFWLSFLSDACFTTYVVEMLVSIKFKHRKLLLTSIATLVLAIGLKVATIGLMMSQNLSIPSYFFVHLVLVVSNCVVPWSLLLLWNKLDQSKWRQTFDLYTKLNSHLQDEFKV